MASPEPSITFKFCALHYLNLWLKDDRKFYQDFHSGNETDALMKAGALFKVARNLPEEYDKNGLDEPYRPEDHRYRHVREILQGYNDAILQKMGPVALVDEIQRRISSAYGNRGVLSLTTKFLWVKYRSPIVIYDRQAREALESSKNSLAGNYEKFHASWATGYRRHEDEIAEACESLPKVRDYCLDSDADIAPLVSQSWFRERVFDIYLWHQGSKR